MKKIKGKAVIGQWGLTLITTDEVFQQKNFDKEVKRLNKLGFSACIVPVKIEIIYPREVKLVKKKI